MSLPPLPEKKNAEEKLRRRKEAFLERVRSGDPTAEEEYREFLIEKGEYFYSLEEIIPKSRIKWYTLDSITLENGAKRNDWARAFKRTRQPDYLAPGGQNGVREFLTTKKTMDGKDKIASLESKGHSSETKKKIWCVDIFARLLEESKNSEVAHLLPDAPGHAVEWYDVACWAMGVDPENIDWSTVLRLLHGTKGKDNKRVFGCGLRHFVANKARINGQERLLDKEDPQLLILPILTIQQCKDWNGEEYEAIVLIGANNDGKSQKWATKEVGMTDVDNITVLDATDGDVKKALCLLDYFTCAMVQSLMNFDVPFVPSSATKAEKKLMESASALRLSRRKKLREAVSALGHPFIPIPDSETSLPLENHRAVCKIRFSNNDVDNFQTGLHVAPDPILLLARATVVWSVRNKFRLRASAVAQDDYDYEQDRMQLELISRMAMEKRVEGLEVTMEQGKNHQHSDHEEMSSISSSESDSLLELEAEKNISRFVPSVPPIVGSFTE